MRSGARSALAVISGAITGSVCVMKDATDCISKVVPRATIHGAMPQAQRRGTPAVNVRPGASRAWAPRPARGLPG